VKRSILTHLTAPVQLGAIVLLLGSNLYIGLAQDNGASQVWVAPSRAARKSNPITADTPSIAKGKDLYVAACFPCHGPGGKGDGPVAGTLERNGVRVRPGNLSDPKLWQETDGALFWKLTEGKTPMPSWGETLSEEQRWTIINYVRTLSSKTDKTDKTDKPQETAKTETKP